MILERIRSSSFSKNETLLQHGTICRFVGIAEEGNLKLSLVGPSSNRVLELLRPGEFVTDYVSFLTGRPSTCEIKAESSGKWSFLTKEDVDFLYTKIPAFERLGRRVSESYFVKTAQRIQEGNFPPSERYLRFLQTRPTLFQEFPSYKIASCLGISAEWLSKIRSRR